MMVMAIAIDKPEYNFLVQTQPIQFWIQGCLKKLDSKGEGHFMGLWPIITKDTLK